MRLNDDIFSNRNAFLRELRSGRYRKGTIRSDETTGQPIFENEDDKNGSCACAIAHDMFFEKSDNDYRTALGIDAKDCRFIQQKLNDTDLTLPEIADKIEDTVFNK